MSNPIRSKVLRDVWGNKVRTLLVVLSIAVGVAAVGMMAAAQVILSSNMRDGFLAVNPASAWLIAEPFDEDLVQAIENMREVGEAEGRYRINARAKSAQGEWRTLQLYAIDDYDHVRINQLAPESGAWPPPDRSVLIERAAMGLLNAQEGDTLVVETPSQKQREMPIAGTLYDAFQWPANFGVIAYGYTTVDTLEWLGEERAYNELYFVAAENPYDKTHVQYVAGLVRDKIEKTGHTVSLVTVRDPGQHNTYSLVQSLVLMLGVIGGLSLLLSSFLVINTISALLAQQMRQIGILKSVGAGTPQVMQIYGSIVVLYGILSIGVALPLGVIGARSFTEIILNLFNFDLINATFPPQALLYQIAVGLIVPLVAALYPIIAGTRVTVREAISGPGMMESSNTNRFGLRLPRVLMNWMPEPVILSLRNTFRRKARLILTLTTLVLGGATFIAVLNVRASLFSTLDEVMNYWKFDLEVNFDQNYHVDLIEQELQQVPGIVKIEGWSGTPAFRVRPDGTENELLSVFAPPPNTTLIEPIIAEGRWLVPEDENAIVVNPAFIREEPDVVVGDTVTLTIEGRETTWTVVGLVTGQIAGMGPMAYANKPYVAEVVRDVNSVRRVLIETEQHTPAFQSQVRQQLIEQLQGTHLRVGTVNSNADIRTGIEGIFTIFVIVTMVMALLLAVVGGLGLTGLMSLNVLERRREIGVLRAVGASNSAVLSIVMVEGVFIGFISWVLASIVAVPLSAIFSYFVGVGFLDMPLTNTLSLNGFGLWFVIAVVIAAVASFLPAWHASSLTVRDVLAYE